MKKVFSFFLSIILLSCLIACSKSDNNSTKSSENDENTINYSESNQNDSSNQSNAVFNTKNIKTITFYAYYGEGKGSVVPDKYLDEIIAWLDSFTISEEVSEILPPGTNTICVEIEYFDGTIVNNGLDTITVDGITHYIKRGPSPDCYEKIISKTSLY